MTTGDGERASQLQHLAEMDRLLRDIQGELMPDREPAPALAGVVGPSPQAAPPPSDPPPPAQPPASDPPPPPPPPATPAPATPNPHLQVLSELSAHLLASTRELLAGYERVLAPPQSPEPPPVRRSARRRPQAPDVTLSAGPFASLEALREFEQAVSHLPGVREVAVRGYEGTDRAIIEVRLDPPR